MAWRSKDPPCAQGEQCASVSLTPSLAFERPWRSSCIARARLMRSRTSELRSLGSEVLNSSTANAGTSIFRSIRSASGPDRRPRYRATASGVHRHFPDAWPRYPHGQGRVALLQFVPIRLKALKPKETDFEPRSLGEHLRKRRLVLGLTQNQAAKQLGINSWTVLNWEKGHTEPPIESMPAIVRFLGYDPFPEPKTLPERLLAKRRAMGWSIRKSRPKAWGRPRDLGRLGTGQGDLVSQTPGPGRSAPWSAGRRSRPRHGRTLDSIAPMTAYAVT